MMELAIYILEMPAVDFVMLSMGTALVVWIVKNFQRELNLYRMNREIRGKQRR